MTTENTRDLSDFGYRELDMAADLLKAYCAGSGAGDFLEDSIAIEFNPNSGCVFLTDGEFNVGMMNGDDLEQWHNCPNCGKEGFLEDMISEADDCCREYLVESGLAEENDFFRARAEIGETSAGSTKLTDIVDGIRDLVPEELIDEFDLYDEDDEDDQETQAGIFDEICDHLDEIAPDGSHFGTSEGDGASYGFWKDEDEETEEEA